jgi:hypothetical protein
MLKTREFTMRNVNTLPAFALPLVADYRHEDSETQGELNDVVRRHLSEAAESLQLAVLVFEGARPEDDREDRFSQISKVREHLADALVALAKARVYVPGIKTYDLRVLTASERDPFAEAARLHHLVTTLLWQNHVVLPAPPRGEPLSPEDEAQLARVIFELRNAEWVQKIRHGGWWLAAGAALFMVPVVGGVAALGVAACSLAGLINLLRSEASARSTAPALARSSAPVLRALRAPADLRK